MQRWLSEPHVYAWWHQALDLAGVAKKYEPRIAGTEPTHVYIIDSASGPIGFIQWYRWSDYPEHAVQLGAERSAAGVDLAVGDRRLIGRGLGPQIIREFLDTRVWPQPDIAAVVVDIDARNARSLRAFEKAGFSRAATIQLEGEDFERNILRLPASAEASASRIVIDWDGTVTEGDTLSAALQHFVPPAMLAPLTMRVDAALAAGRMTLQDVMAAEFSTMTAPIEAVVEFIREHTQVRAGFSDFVRMFDPLILSTSFHETIEPILAREGVTATVRAGRVTAAPHGWQIQWMSNDVCVHCGERCKRCLLPTGPVIYVGDGYSDRCAARAATRIFARDGLARYLDELAIVYEPFTDFRDLAAALA